MKDLLTRSMFIILIAALLSCCSEGHLEDESHDRVERLLKVQNDLEENVENLENLILCHLTNETVQSFADLGQNRFVRLNDEFYDIIVRKTGDEDAFYFELVKYEAGVKHILHSDEYADLIGLEPDQGAWLRTAIVAKRSYLTVYQLGYSYRRCSDIILRRQYDLFPNESNHLSPFELKNESYSLKSDPYDKSSLSCFGSPKENYLFLNRVEGNLSTKGTAINWVDWDKGKFLSAFVSGENCSILLE